MLEEDELAVAFFHQHKLSAAVEEIGKAILGGEDEFVFYRYGIVLSSAGDMDCLSLFFRLADEVDVASQRGNEPALSSVSREMENGPVAVL